MSKEITFNSKQIMRLDSSQYMVDIAGESLYEAVNRVAKNYDKVADLISAYDGVDKMIGADAVPYEVYASFDKQGKPHLALDLLEHDISVPIPLSEKETASLKKEIVAFEKAEVNAVINNHADKISVQGYKGTWYVIDNCERNGDKYFLLEHEKYGDETACLIVDEKGELVVEDVWNGFDDLDYHFENQDDMEI